MNIKSVRIFKAFNFPSTKLNHLNYKKTLFLYYNFQIKFWEYNSTQNIFILIKISINNI